MNESSCCLAVMLTLQAIHEDVLFIMAQAGGAPCFPRRVRPSPSISGLGRLIESAVGAPWQDPYRSDIAEMKSLARQDRGDPGKSDHWSGRQVVCQGPALSGQGLSRRHALRRRIRRDAAVRRCKSADPSRIAAKLGFRGSSWKTLETGCGNELDFHFLDPATADFGLNNYVYTMKKR